MRAKRVEKDSSYSWFSQADKHLDHRSKLYRRIGSDDNQGEVWMERRWIARTRQTRDLGEGSALTSGIVRHDSYVRGCGGDPAGDRARFTLVGGECSSH
ncbi:hypothetical protein PR048_026181 [Dryococelus australis]|uniref:Uncharacterized protein n=1 Tax=Dryococelus australis TaxID=614101 RepID=A0ABQ9GKM6_9NEOP|nr:hypothetical protein PR048_026181 [Dryococelus australis]